MNSTKRVTIFDFDPDKFAGARFKVKEGKRRMKLYIKMTKAETEQWNALKEAAKPPEMGDDSFARVLFYKGIEGFMTELTERVNSMSEDEKKEALEKAGIDPDSVDASALNAKISVPSTGEEEDDGSDS